jgi:ABC-type lipoprotein export system ATPase subunit
MRGLPDSVAPVPSNCCSWLVSPIKPINCHQPFQADSALANDPPIIIADEPTGNLDSETARTVLNLFRKLLDLGTTVVIATHERDISGIDRTFELVDGAIASKLSVATGLRAQEVG